MNTACTYPQCKCIVSTSTSQPEPICPKGHARAMPAPFVALAKSREPRWAYQIEIDGVAWAYVDRTSHGMHGHSYQFYQIGGEQIVRAKPDGWKPKYSTQRPYDEIRVRSASARASRLGTETDARPTTQRLIDTAKELIAEGLLRHPEIVKAELEENRKAYTLNRERADAARIAEFRQRAAECLPGGELPNGTENEATISKIVAAMKWAQTQ